MSFQIRNGNINDMPAVLELIKELAQFEKEPEAVLIIVDDLIENGFSDAPSFKIYVAEMDADIVGIALFYPRFSTWKGTTLHLEDLIVKENKRGLGIGKALYIKFLEYAKQEKVKRVEWVVLNWNTNAIDFYQKSGAKVFDDWQIVQMDENNLHAYLS